MEIIGMDDNVPVPKPPWQTGHYRRITGLDLADEDWCEDEEALGNPLQDAQS